MYLGHWVTDFEYKKGYIVFSKFYKEYYICAIDHISCDLVQPSPEDMYWIYIDSKFLYNYAYNDINCGILFFSKDALPYYTQKYVNETQNHVQNNNFSPPPPPPAETEQTEQQEEDVETKESIVLNNINPESVRAKRKIRGIKRKLQSIENKLEDYKKKKTIVQVNSLKDRLLLLDLDIDTKYYIMEKYENILKMTSSDYSKGINWLNTVTSLPYNKLKPLKITKKDSPENLVKFFKNIKEKLDNSILGLEDVKQEILEFVARKITNPKSKGHILALSGVPGVGKSKLSKCLGEILELPFFQINCGGLNDASLLLGHSETYVGAKSGKIVEILQKANCMNPIIYLDEIDKISEHKATEINGVLTHLLDEEQNDKFQDNYLSGINLDLSNAFFILSFNDESKLDKIVSDRMKIIYINPPSLEDKVNICQNKLLPDIIKSININKDIEISKELIEYIIVHKCSNEPGVRNLKKALEKLLNRINYDLLINEKSIENESESEIYKINRKYIDKIFDTHKKDAPYLNMYL